MLEKKKTLRTHKRRNGILLEDWAAVRSALTLFAGGDRSEAEHETVSSTIHDGNIMGAALEIMFSDHQRQSGQSQRIVTDLMTKAEGLLNTETGFAEFRDNFEYEAMGTPFFKLAVRIARLGDNELQGPFLLGLGYDQNVESEWARRLKARHILEYVWLNVPVQTGEVTNSFRVDLNWLADRLNQFLPKLTTAYQLMRAFDRNTVGQYDEHRINEGNFVYQDGSGMQLVIKLPSPRWGHDCRGKATIFTGYRHVDHWWVSENEISSDGEKNVYWRDGIPALQLTFSWRQKRKRSVMCSRYPERPTVLSPAREKKLLRFAKRIAKIFGES